MAEFLARGGIATQHPLLARFHHIPLLRTGIYDKRSKTWLSIPDAALLNPEDVEPDWKCIGTSPLVRARLVNAVPASLSEFAGRIWTAITDSSAFTGQHVLSAQTKPGSVQALAPGKAGLIARLQVACWNFKSGGPHMAPITAARAWVDKEGNLYFSQDEHARALDLGALAQGPEDYWWENALQRQDAGATQSTLKQEDLDQFWNFVDFVRQSSTASAEGNAVKNEKKWSRPAVPAALAASSTMFSVDEIVAAAYSSKPSPANEVKKAVASLDAAKKLAPLDPSAANKVFILSTLPDVAEAMFSKYTPLQLRKIRTTYNMMCIPVLRALERVFWRTPPSPGQLKSEWSGSPQAKQKDAERMQEAYLQIATMISGKDAPKSTDFDQLGDLEFYRTVYGDSDESGLDSCMKNHVRFGMYASWLMLVGGKEVFNKAAGHDESNLCRGKLPTGATTRDFIGSASLPELFARLNPTAELHAQRMGIESSLMLLALLNYDMFTTFAQRAHMIAIQGRPRAGAPDPLPAPLPGFAEFVQRLSVHPELRPWDHVFERPVDPIVCPAWGLEIADGSWHLLQQ
jgi:hypothetical protein